MIVNFRGVLLDTNQISALGQVLKSRTDERQIGTFDLHMNGTVFPITADTFDEAVTDWNALLASWQEVNPHVQTFRVGPGTDATAQIALGLQHIALVGPVQIMPVEELHVQQRALVAAHLNGTIINADYDTQIGAEAGRQEIVSAWQAS